MPDKEWLVKGLSIISSCKRETKDIWQAHLGAAAIAAYFFTKENELPAETVHAIEAQAAAMLQKHQPDKVGAAASEILEPKAAEQLILEALDLTIDGLHWVGHNVIYSAVSLLAIHELGGWGSRQQIEGIAELIRSFQRTIPGRSWLGCSVSEVKQLEPEEADRFPAIENGQQLSGLILDELSSFRTIYNAEAHHDLIGHMLTYSHAINILDDLGHHSYFKRTLPPLLKLIKALRKSREPALPLPLNSPVDRQPLALRERSEYLPAEPRFWTGDYSAGDWEFGHMFKFPFSFYNHLNRVPGKNPAAIENFRYIIGII